MIKLHHLNRSRSLRILWLFEELGLDYKIIRYEREAKTNLAPSELLTLHPLGKSPMIEMDGRLISESGAIIEVICARYGKKMIPDANTDAYITHMELMHFAEGSVMTPILLDLYIAKLGDAAAPLQPRIQSELSKHSLIWNKLCAHLATGSATAFRLPTSCFLFPHQSFCAMAWPSNFPKLPPS